MQGAKTLSPNHQPHNIASMKPPVTPSKESTALKESLLTPVRSGSHILQENDPCHRLESTLFAKNVLTQPTIHPNFGSKGAGFDDCDKLVQRIARARCESPIYQPMTELLSLINEHIKVQCKLDGCHPSRFTSFPTLPFVTSVQPIGSFDSWLCPISPRGRQKC